MSISRKNESKKIVVFDRFYKNQGYSSEYDSISDVVENRYNVLANAYSLSAAVALLLAIKDDTLETPDVIVTGGLLEDEMEYVSQPHVITLPETKTVRTLRGKKTVPVEVNYLALPIVNSEGDVRLPRSEQPGIDYTSRSLFMEGWQRSGSELALSGFVISHLTKELLEDKEIKVIGHASIPFGSSLPVDAFVSKREYASPIWLSEAVDQPLG